MLTVGQIPLRRPIKPAFFDALEALVHADTDSPVLTQLAKDSYDPRMTVHAWHTTLVYELHMLFKWSLQRSSALAQAQIAPGPPAPAQVLTLLPAYGFALHALRRAVPFAALGVPTVLSFPANVLAQARGPVVQMARALGLVQHIEVCDMAPETLVARKAAAGVPIYVTGRQSTVQTLRRQYPEAHITGATGRCCIVVGTDLAQVTALAQCRQRGQLSTSCSNWGLSVCCASLEEDAPITAHASSADFQLGTQATLGQTIALYHPSLILTPESSQAGADIPSSIMQYPLFPCDIQGEPLTRMGFARDRLFGWPGDYCV